MSKTVTDKKMTSERVLALAEQARLGVTEAEAHTLALRLQSVLDAAEELYEVDTTGVEPLFQLSHQVKGPREDRIGPSLSNEAALAGAPDVQDGFFKVPRLHDQ